MASSLPRRIKNAFILQGVVASFVIVIGVLATGIVVKNALLTERMRNEADAYWMRHSLDPHTPLPSTSTLRGYVVPRGGKAGDVPENLRDLPPGLHRLADEGRTVYVDERPQGRFYITFSSDLVDRVVLLSGLFTIGLSLLALYLVSWRTYHTSKRLVTPVDQLARQVAAWDPNDPNTAILDPGHGEEDSEVRQLSSALHRLAARIRDFVQRERDFTRDSSHELRTPLTVIRVATDMLLDGQELEPKTVRALHRIQRAGRDMEQVIDAFLILAREADVAPQSEDFSVLDIVYEEIGKSKPLCDSKQIELRVEAKAEPRVHAPPRVLGVMLGNLLGNACTFTDEGSVLVEVMDDRIRIRDTGIGMSDDTLQHAFEPFYRADPGKPHGKGMGLSIVRRLGDRFGWPVQLESAPGRGTTATIHFGG